MPSARCGTRSRPPSSNGRRSRSTSRSTSCWATSRGRRATGCPGRASRPGSSPTSPSTGRRGARPRTDAGTSTRSSTRRRRSRWRSCCGCSASPRRPTSIACFASIPTSSPLVGADRLERAGLTVEVSHPDPNDPDDTEPHSFAVEVTYEGLYELAEETLADGTSSVLDETSGCSAAGWPPPSCAWATCGSPSCPPTTPPSDDPAARSLRGRRAHRHHHAQPTRCPQRADREALEILGESIERAEHDGDVDVMILTGADPAFCAASTSSSSPATPTSCSPPERRRRRATTRVGRSARSPSRSSAPSTGRPSPAVSSWHSTATSSWRRSGRSSVTPTRASG